MSTLPPSPIATRLRQSSWLDPRLIIGVLLIVSSTLIGALIFSGADNTVPRWAVTKDLAVGTTLKASDVVVRHVRPNSQDPYLAGDVPVAGKTLSREMKTNELLPRSAIQSAPAGALATIGVQDISLSSAITHGTQVDVWHSTDNQQAGVRLLAGVTVESVVSSRGENGISLGTGTAQVTLRVTPHEEEQLMGVVGKGTLHIVALTGQSPRSQQPNLPPSATSAPPKPSTSAPPASASSAVVPSQGAP